MEEKEKLAYQLDDQNEPAKNESFDDKNFKSNIAKYWGVTPSQYSNPISIFSIFI
jgi:hypothetical protein